MSERTREEKAADAQAREAEAQAREAEEAAAKKAAAREPEKDDAEQTEEEAEARKGPIGPWLSRSPASRMALALSVAGVPLAAHLEPYVVEFDWRADGHFEMRLNRALQFEVDDAALAFEVTVSGRAAYDGLTELDGVHASQADGGGAVERIVAEGPSGPLVLQVEGLGTPIRMPQPDDSPDKTV